MGLRNAFREGVEPPIRLPLIRIFSPDSLLPVCTNYRNDDVRVVLDRDFRDLRLSVSGLDGPEEGKDDILPRTTRTCM